MKKEVNYKKKGSMQQFKIKVSQKCHKWKLSKREFGQYRRKWGFGVSYEDFLEYLDDLYVYYLNDLGLSINLNGKPVEKESAQYMWAQTDKTFNKEPLYVWMHQKRKGEFANISIGTRTMFDKEIACK
jgi:hypothetical protein